MFIYIYPHIYYFNYFHIALQSSLPPSLSCEVIFLVFEKHHLKHAVLLFYLHSSFPLNFLFDIRVLGFPSGSDSKKNLPEIGETQVWSLGWEDRLEKGMATYTQYSCLENSIDRGAWQTTVQGVTRSKRWLSDKYVYIAD